MEFMPETEEQKKKESFKCLENAFQKLQGEGYRFLLFRNCLAIIDSSDKSISTINIEGSTIHLGRKIKMSIEFDDNGMIR